MFTQKIIIKTYDGFSYFDRPDRFNSSAWTFVYANKEIVRIQTLSEIIKIRRLQTIMNLMEQNSSNGKAPVS